MKKRWIAALLIAALLLPAAALSESRPLLYRVTDEMGHTIYLFGTIHVGNQDMYPLSGAVEEALAESDVLAVELDVQSILSNLTALLRYSASLVYLTGDDAANHLSEETYRLGIEKLGYAEFLLRRMKPIAWYSLADEYAYSLAGLSSDWGVDMQLLSKAKKLGKTVEETESLDGQMRLLLDLPDEVLDEQIYLILTNPEECAEETRALAEMWQRGDREGLEAMLVLQEETGNEGDSYEAFNDALIYDRNEGFEEKAKAYLKNGTTAMIAIGAFHILGQDGLAARLARAGYQVEEIGR